MVRDPPGQLQVGEAQVVHAVSLELGAPGAAFEGEVRDLALLFGEPRDLVVVAVLGFLEDGPRRCVEFHWRPIRYVTDAQIDASGERPLGTYRRGQSVIETWDTYNYGPGG